MFFYACGLDAGVKALSLKSMKMTGYIVGMMTGVAALVCAELPVAYAQQISENRPLNFGTFAVARNDTVQSITVTPENDTYADTGIAVGMPGERGYYTLSDMPANVSFFLGVDTSNPPSEGGIVLDNASQATTGSGASFVLDNLTIANGGVLQTDSQGDAVLYIGGTLRTTGTGQKYTGGVYSGTYTLTIHY